MPVSPALILASASQRRQQFLRDLEVPFSIQVAAIDESPLPGEEAAAMTQRLAEAKAWAAAGLVEKQSPHALIVASDTTVALDGLLYGKPADAAEAAQMLRALRGRDHAVTSAVTVLRLPDRRLATRVNQTLVTMRAYTDHELDAYVQSGDPLDKAGAYGIQSVPFAPVCALQGCYAGVMGLPLADLCALLAQFGMPIPKPAADVCRPINPFGCCACGHAAARPQETPPGRDDFEQLPCT
ncbi:MAG: Maf family protein [Caldilinea sp.]|jgi:septum formation protein|nr:Maf family protein [Caldilinea sp.]